MIEAAVKHTLPNFQLDASFATDSVGITVVFGDSGAGKTTLVNILSGLVTPALMGGARVRMVGPQIYEDVLAVFNWPGGSAMSIVLIVITLVLLIHTLRRVARRGRLEASR